MYRNDINALVEQNIDIVHYVINSYFFANKNIIGLEYDDLFQVGCIGLMKAAEKFDPDRCFKFNTFANKVIKHHITSHLRTVLNKQKDTFCETEVVETLLSVEDDSSNCLVEKELMDLLDSVKCNYSGVKLKGIEVIKLSALGYDNKMIAKIFNTSEKNVSNWRYIAKSELKKNKSIVEYLKNS